MDGSGDASSPQDHHSSSSSGAPRVMTKNSIRSAPCTPDALAFPSEMPRWARRVAPPGDDCTATGPVSTPAAVIRASAVAPATAGTSRTSKTRPVARITFASGRVSHHCPMTASSTVACICQVGDTGCAPGAGHPTRSHEQARPGSGIPRLSSPPLGCAPGHTGQPIAAYCLAAAPSDSGRCVADRRPRRRIIVTIKAPRTR